MQQNRSRRVGRSPLQEVDTGTPPRAGARGVAESGTVLRAAVPRPPDVPCGSMAEVVDRYQDYVFKIIQTAGLGEDADAISQDVFVGMNKSVRKHGMPERVTSMLAVITWRRIYDRLRVRVKEREHEAGVDLEAMPASQRDPEQQVSGAELVAMVRDILERMPPLPRLILQQHEMWDMTAEEIGESLGCPANTVRGRLKRARELFLAIARRVHRLDVGDLR